MKPSAHFAIVVAAGNGLRMESKTRKQFLCLGGIPILSRTLMVFDASKDIHEIILVVPKDAVEFCKTQILDPYGFKTRIHLVQGGKERQGSVFNGLKFIQNQLKPDIDTIVMIHDGVRPFVDQCIIENCIQKALQYGGCIPAVKVTDTLKEVFPDFVIRRTLNRETLYQAQTPQTFKLSLILQAFNHAYKTFFSGTDEASLLEHFGHKVHIVKGSKLNIKITCPEDLVLGEILLSINI